MKQIIFSVSILCIVFSFSCKKKASGGLGGNTTLIIKSAHHGSPIDSCNVSIKFNSLDAPSDGKYDLTQSNIKDANGDYSVIISGLKKGDYYIYGYGWDPSISNFVKGGIPYTISDETSINISLPVSED